MHILLCLFIRTINRIFLISRFSQPPLTKVTGFSANLDKSELVTHKQYCLLVDGAIDNFSATSACVISALTRAALIVILGTKDRKSTRLNSSHTDSSRMPSSS